MTLTEELRRRLSLRSTIVGLHTAMLELRESMEDALAAVGGEHLGDLRVEAAYDDGLTEGEELAKCTYLDQAREHRKEAEALRASFSGWGVIPNGP